MKKLSAFVLSALAALLIFAFAGCGDKEPYPADENTVVITAEYEGYDFTGKTLLDYMTFLKSEGRLTFKTSGTMVTEMNGKAQTAKKYWMLYSDDGDYTDRAWGELEYNSKIYCSVSVGAGELPVKRGCTYIWAYRGF